ncbi:phasin [Caballeronia calidae]|uniref:Phasin n=1 Tax=Caballeronia calidae TaxID=1777139 RepID=A0A158BXN3_9BURK|nr:phasin family protein [Caballeronia calidae]SAK74858.1 phasin [Caballeronia calidae]
METTRPKSLIADYLGFVTQLRLPRIDVNAMLESRRKDIEALAAANTTALAGLQSLGQKQAEIVNARITRVQSMIARQKDQEESKVQANARTALSDVRELVDTAYRAHGDSIAVISKRVAENVEEWKALLQPKK